MKDHEMEYLFVNSRRMFFVMMNRNVVIRDQNKYIKNLLSKTKLYSLSSVDVM